jgi:hypothetical protein
MKSKESGQWMASIGCIPEYTNAHSSQSNPAEGAIKKISRSSEALRIAAGLPRAAWAECRRTATFYENILPCSSNVGNKSPFEMRFPDKKPDVSNLKVVGETCYVIKPVSQQHAVEPLAIKGVFVGYAENTNGFRICTNHLTGGVIETANVKFLPNRIAPEVADILTTAPRSTIPTLPEPPRRLNLPPGVEPIPQSAIPVASTQSFRRAAQRSSQFRFIDSVHSTETDGERPHLIIPSDLEDHLDADYVQKGQQKPAEDDERLRHFPLTASSNSRNKKPLRAFRVAILHKEAISDPLIAQSLDDEASYLMDTGKIRVEKLPTGHVALRSLWATKVKDEPTLEDPNHKRVKSRLCPFGCDQKPLVHFNPNEVSAPAISIEGLFFFLSITAALNLVTYQTDIDSAFQQTICAEELYMRFPPGWPAPFSGAVLKILHNLQGLRQSAYKWHAEAQTMILREGFTELTMMAGMYYRHKNGEFMIIALYVDDFRYAATSNIQLDEFKSALEKKWKCKHPSPNKCLGLQISHNLVDGVLEISQSKYIQSLITKYNMEDCKPSIVPAAPGTKLARKLEEDNFTCEFPFRELVGALLWIARCSRPDILYAVNQVGAHSHNPSEAHVTALKKILRYLKGTIQLPLVLRRPIASSSGLLTVEVWTDADFGAELEGNENAKRSLSGGHITIAGVGKFAAISSLQSMLARATTIAEARAAATSAEFAEAARYSLLEMGLGIDVPAVFHQDNQSCIARHQKVLSGGKSRHEIMDHAFLREKIINGEIIFKYCPTDMMIADIYTKALSKDQFILLRDFALGHVIWASPQLCISISSESDEDQDS